MIDATSEQIDQHARQDPYVDVLCQIRGIGRYLALLIIAEIGDITRFPSALLHTDEVRASGGARSEPFALPHLWQGSSDG